MQPPIFSCLNYLHNMGIFVIEIFLLDFPFKGRNFEIEVCNFSGVIHTVEIISEVSLWIQFQQCHLHH
jgi:hypothetical protein